MWWLFLTVTGLLVVAADLGVRSVARRGSIGAARRPSEARNVNRPKQMVRHHTVNGTAVPAIRERPRALRRTHRLTAPRRPPNRSAIRREAWPTQRSR